MTNSPFETDHATLVAHAQQLVVDLGTFGQRIETGEISYGQHRTYAERVSALAEQLGAAIDLAGREAYGQSFCLLRPALEQIVFDRLLCLASQYVRQIADVSLETFEEWKQDWRAKTETTKHIQRMIRDPKTGTVRLELRGLVSSTPGDEDQVLSVYYFLLEQFQPFVMPAKDQERLLPRGSSGRDRERHAREQHAMYYTSLRWDALLANLRLNDLATTEDQLRIKVHYRFLSAFVHPLNDHYRTLYGRHMDFDRAPRYDHFSSELVLLYIIAFAAYEFETLLRVSERPPTFEIRDAVGLRATVQTARTAISYLWFVGDAPTDFDRVQEANQRNWAELKNGTLGSVDWRSLSGDEIRYYEDPLSRLVRLHGRRGELLGASYVSPWPRQDADFR